jgi:hypothetical protein
LCGLLIVPIVKMLKVSGLLHAALSIYALTARSIPEVGPGARNILGALTSAAILTLYGFLLKQLFVETRYALIASLLLCVWAPFALDDIVERHARSRMVKAAIIAAFMVTLVFGMQGLRQADDEHVVEALAFVERHTPPGCRLYTNSAQVAYYARRVVDWNEVYRAIGEEQFDVAAVQRSDYCVFRFGANDSEKARRAAFERSGITILKSYVNTAGESVVVYQRVPLAEGAAG